MNLGEHMIIILFIILLLLLNQQETPNDYYRVYRFRMNYDILIKIGKTHIPYFFAFKDHLFFYHKRIIKYMIIIHGSRLDDEDQIFLSSHNNAIILKHKHQVSILQV